MVNYNLKEIEGIGPANSRKMQTAKIQTVRGLLKKGGTPKGRKELAERTGLSESVILKWVNMADLFRVKGIGKEYSELLEKSGVDTVKELATRRPDRLYAKIAETNDRDKLTTKPPTQAMIEDWVRQAKGLKPILTY